MNKKAGSIMLGGITPLRGLCLFLLLLTFSFGCAARNEAVKKEEDRGEAKSGYNEALNKWTRSKKLYEGLETRLYINATYKSPEFREAYVERYAKSYQLDEDFKKALLERETAQHERYNEFFFTAYTPEDRWNDFANPDSVWRLYLDDGMGGKIRPVSIARVDKSDPLLREFFPYFDPWSIGYVARFPKYSETGEPVPSPRINSIKLVVTGVLAKGELEWRIK